MAGERAVRAPSNGHSMDAETTSPVLLALAKRLRNQRKKLRGIDEIQAKADVGKALNADQVMASDPGWRGLSRSVDARYPHATHASRS